jgi:hypothetical protein
MSTARLAFPFSGDLPFAGVPFNELLVSGGSKINNKSDNPA